MVCPMVRMGLIGEVPSVRVGRVFWYRLSLVPKFEETALVGSILQARVLWIVVSIVFPLVTPSVASWT